MLAVQLGRTTCWLNLVRRARLVSNAIFYTTHVSLQIQSSTFTEKKEQKIKAVPKTWVSPNNRLNNSDQKLKTFTFGTREQNKGTTKPQKQQLKLDLVTRRK